MAAMGSRIIKAREDKGWLQADLASHLQVSTRTVSRWETGARVPSVADLERIAAALEKPLGYFLEEAPVAVRPVPELADALRTIFGAAGLAGPPETVARVLSGLQAAGDSGEVPDAIANKERPNARHTGIHELLDLVDAGKPLPAGIVLSAEEEEGLRTYGRSGPAVDTLDKAVDLVLQWRQWAVKDQMRRG